MQTEDTAHENIASQVPHEETNDIREQSGASQTTQANHTTAEKTAHTFDCNICFDSVSSPVISLCGHLFCSWPCIAQWLEAPHNASQTCPVCKSVLTIDKLIPVYGRGGDSVDPRSTPRPAARRTEPPSRGSYYPGFGGVQVGFGPLLFGPFVGYQYQWPPRDGTEPRSDSEIMSQRLLIIGLVLVFLLFFL
ncbi:E3 ubiquitin-protein ligase [Planoprotostelium fungivorum]|uniref:RING-type E3 ubiquitin transferase n=1 Tax=Planoprotostelium fungivorum TaxID=1890364 RepID=A0A2P6NGT2_9EUKA|nr:E3 ubiquitin-protein ligase [Planoprotostelium fungivorum]